MNDLKTDQPRSRFLTICLSHAPGMDDDRESVVGRTFRGGVQKAIGDFVRHDPDLVVVFGSDHRRAYQQVIPSSSVVLSADSLGDRGSPTGEYLIPAEVASGLAEHLLRRKFDIAVSRCVSLDHGFGQSVGIFGPLDARRVLPVFINCATPPLQSPERAVELGRAVHEFLETLDTERIAVIGSGGLSHSPPTLEVDTIGLDDSARADIARRGRSKAATKIDPAWDTDVLSRFAEPDHEWLSRVPQGFIDVGGVGANELRVWLAAWAAGGCEPLATLAYEPVPSWITGMGVVTSHTGAGGYDGKAGMWGPSAATPSPATT